MFHFSFHTLVKAVQA